MPILIFFTKLFSIFKYKTIVSQNLNQKINYKYIVKINSVSTNTFLFYYNDLNSNCDYSFEYRIINKKILRNTYFFQKVY